MCKRGLLNGGDWPVVRMLFSSILKLFYVILVSRSSSETESLFKSLATARKVMSHLAKQSNPGNRCKVMLKVIQALFPNIHVACAYLDKDYDLNSPEGSPRSP